MSFFFFFSNRHPKWYGGILTWWLVMFSIFQCLATFHIPVGHCRHSVKVISCSACWTLWDLMDCSLPGSSVHGISQVKNTGCDAISSSRGSFRPRDWTHTSFISALQGDSLPIERFKSLAHFKIRFIIIILLLSCISFYIFCKWPSCQIYGL